MLSHFAQFAHQYDVILEDASIDLRASFDSAAKYDLSDESTAFKKVTIKLSIQSPSPLENVRKLVEFADRVCHTHRSFQTEVPVSLKTYINKEPLPLSSS